MLSQIPFKLKEKIEKKDLEKQIARVGNDS